MWLSHDLRPWFALTWLLVEAIRLSSLCFHICHCWDVPSPSEHVRLAAFEKKLALSTYSARALLSHSLWIDYAEPPGATDVDRARSDTDIMLMQMSVLCLSHSLWYSASQRGLRRQEGVVINTGLSDLRTSRSLEAVSHHNIKSRIFASFSARLLPLNVEIFFWSTHIDSKSSTWNKLVKVRRSFYFYAEKHTFLLDVTIVCLVAMLHTNAPNSFACTKTSDFFTPRSCYSSFPYGFFLI